MDAFVLHFDNVLRDDNASVDAFNAPLNLLHGVVGQEPSSAPNESFAPSLFPTVFLFAHLLPQVHSVDVKQQEVAKGLWENWIANASEESKDATLSAIKHLLRELLSDPASQPTYVRLPAISLCAR